MSTKNKWKNPLGITQKMLVPLFNIPALMRHCDETRYQIYSPYFHPLRSMVDAKDAYGDDTGISVCLYALSNWTGSRSKVEYTGFPGTPLRTVIAEMLRAQVFVAEGGVLPTGEV